MNNTINLTPEARAFIQNVLTASVAECNRLRSYGATLESSEALRFAEAKVVAANNALRA